MKKSIFYFLLLGAFLTNCGNQSKDNKNRTKILFETNKGDILLALYNETPRHRDNFIKLTKDNYFDGTLFHRVIDNFMIQGGDPDSKNAKAGEALGNGGPGYEIDAEFVPDIIHKKGVLAAARNGDDINPQRKSAGSQFYIVEGRIFTEKDLDNLEKSKNQALRNSLITKFKDKNKSRLDSLMKLQASGKDAPLEKLLAELNTETDSIIAKEGFHFTPLQRKTYTTVGGTPHLDGAYTVFGEVIEGQDIVDEIAEVTTDELDRPKEDVIIKRAKIVK